MSIQEIQDIGKGGDNQDVTASSGGNLTVDRTQEQMNEKKPCFMPMKETIMKMNDVMNNNAPVYFVHCQS